MCGGTSAAAPTAVIVKGLSPRVRGNPARRRPGPARQRSIPACAGEPPTALLRCCTHPVYPRVCGGTTSKRMVDWQFSSGVPFDSIFWTALIASHNVNS